MATCGSLPGAAAGCPSNLNTRGHTRSPAAAAQSAACTLPGLRCTCCLMAAALAAAVSLLSGVSAAQEAVAAVVGLSEACAAGGAAVSKVTPRNRRPTGSGTAACCAG